MDSSLSKALIMVAGVLLAMLVIAFITVSFNRIGEWATTSDEELSTEQKEEFNKEFEVYDKSLMYGVDFISCLNKAKSNNDKINNKFGESIDASYEVKVTVYLLGENNKVELSESLEVSHLSNDGIEIAYQNSGPENAPSLGDLNFKFLNTAYDELSGTFGKNYKLKSKMDSSVTIANPLVLTKDSTESDDIIKLLSAADAISQTVKNPDYKTRNDVNGWTKAEFRSALYYLKTKKFKCTGITYKDNGRIESIGFKEVKTN